MHLEYGGKEVLPGQKFVIDDEIWVIDGVVHPHKPSSSGSINVHLERCPDVSRVYYPSVIKAEWVGREDQFRQPIIRWNIADVKSLRPEWTDVQCARYLDHICKPMEEAMSEVGWGVMKNMMSAYEAEVMEKP